jgi:hypothetical protein
MIATECGDFPVRSGSESEKKLQMVMLRHFEFQVSYKVYFCERSSWAIEWHSFCGTWSCENLVWGGSRLVLWYVCNNPIVCVAKFEPFFYIVIWLQLYFCCFFNFLLLAFFSFFLGKLHYQLCSALPQLQILGCRKERFHFISLLHLCFLSLLEYNDQTSCF